MSCIRPYSTVDAKYTSLFRDTQPHEKPVRNTVYSCSVLTPTKPFYYFFLKKHTISEHRILYFLIFAKYLTIFTTIH